MQANRGILALNQQAMQQGLAYQQMINQLTREKVQRRVDVGMFKSQQARAIAENRIKAGSANLLSGIANSTGQAKSQQQVPGGARNAPMLSQGGYPQIDPNQANKAPVTPETTETAPQVDINALQGMSSADLMTF